MPISHLNWTATQGKILTADGKASSYFTAERGYPFTNDECPHHHLASGTSREAFKNFSERQPRHPVVGGWSRTLFTGGCSHTTESDESCYNLQGRGCFIDLRLPTTKPNFAGHSSLSTLLPSDLRAYARQHVFGGYTRVDVAGSFPVATRHHVVDWNYLQDPRNIPNKWGVRMDQSQDVWREVSYAKDEEGEPYYWEKWERLPGDAGGKEYAAFRRRGEEGLIVCVGGLFNYLYPRIGSLPSMGGLPVSVADKLVEAGDLEGARAVLSIRGGHGIIVDGTWVVQRAIAPWEEGCTFLGSGEAYFNSGEVTIKGDIWDLVEDSGGGYVERIFSGGAKSKL